MVWFWLESVGIPHSGTLEEALESSRTLSEALKGSGIFQEALGRSGTPRDAPGRVQNLQHASKALPGSVLEAEP